MRVLYIYPHPDDESFGPAPAIAKQRREGHEVFLFTLTRGGATRQREKYGYTIDQMGAVRYQEMQAVEEVLGLSGMTVLDLVDSGLKGLDPRAIEDAIRKEIERLQPQIVVTYPVHGISGFHDHIVTHAVVKRVYVELRETRDYLKRLAFLTITAEEAKSKSAIFPLSGSTPAEIDCVVEVDKADVEKGRRALDCYVTFQETIEKSGIRDFLGGAIPYEFFQESYDPPVDDLFAGLES